MVFAKADGKFWNMPWMFQPANSGQELDRPSGHAVSLRQLEGSLDD